jgi:hypothetical protein
MRHVVRTVATKTYNKFIGELLPPKFDDTMLRVNFDLYYDDINPGEPITDFKVNFFILMSF